MAICLIQFSTKLWKDLKRTNINLIPPVVDFCFPPVVDISRNNQSHFARCLALRLLCNSFCGPRIKGWRTLWTAYVCYSWAINQWTGGQCPIAAQIVWCEHSTAVLLNRVNGSPQGEWNFLKGEWKMNEICVPIFCVLDFFAQNVSAIVNKVADCKGSNFSLQESATDRYRKTVLRCK